MSLPLKVNPLPREQRKSLEHLTRRAVGRVAERARMVLLSTEGRIISEIATIFHCHENQVRRWIKRYLAYGVDGLYDKPRSGRPSRAELFQNGG